MVRCSQTENGVVFTWAEGGAVIGKEDVVSGGLTGDTTSGRDRTVYEARDWPQRDVISA